MEMFELERRCPAAFVSTPYSGVSNKYVFIGTKPVIESLANEGWVPVDGKQAKARSYEKAPYTRHLIRFRNNEIEPIADPRNGSGKNLHMELILINGHDGSASYTLHAGLFSFVCCNGLIVGSMLDSITVRHMGLKATLEAVTTGATHLVATQLPKLAGAVEQMSTRHISRSEQHEFARHALELRYKGMPPVLTTDQMLSVHRNEDAANDVWTTLNVIQENVLSVKHDGHSFTGRRTRIGAVTAVRESTAINRGLWDYAMKIAA
jgi:hypothetical protein